MRKVYFDGEFVETPIIARQELGEGAKFSGPAIVTQSDATVVVDPRAETRVDGFGNLVIDVGSDN